MPLVGFPVTLWVIFSFNTVWAATGLYLSLRLRKVTTAVIVNLLIPVFLFIAVPIAASVLGEIFAREDTWAEITGLYVPYVYLAQILSRRNSYTPNSQDLWLPVLSYVPVATYLICVFAAGAIHILMACVIVRRTEQAFNRLVGRSRQVIPITPAEC